MQLSNLPLKASWIFLFGAATKSSLGDQYASEHKIPHIKASKAQDYAFKDHVDQGLVIECPATLFRQLEGCKPEIQTVFIGCDLSSEEVCIKKDYLKIGRCACLEMADYKCFRRSVYPKLIILFGACPIQNRFLKENYFSFTGYILIKECLSANQMISQLPKDLNYIFTGVTPEPSELSVLEEYFDVQVVHLKHQRTELSNQDAFFDLEARIMPELSKKDYVYTLNTSTSDLNITEEIGSMLLPSLVFINASNKEESAGAMEYIEKNNAILLDTPDLVEILKRKGLPALSGVQLISLLINIVWKNADKDVIFFTCYPTRPDEFALLEEKTRSFSLFADCTSCEKYEPSMSQNPPIYFLETHKRKHIDCNIPFDQQVRSSTKYFMLAGPQGVGKTCAAKYICANYGFKHIEYETYLPSVKEKLMGGEEGEEVPLPKIIKHFASLIQESADTPLLIDGINFEWKDIDCWVEANGPPTIINLKTDEKEMIKRYRKKTEGDVNAEITEDDTKAASEKIAKNAEWIDQFGSRCPSSTIYQVDFSPQLILAEKLLDDILRPRIFVVQSNQTTLFQNIAIRYNMGFFDLRRQSLEEIAVHVRCGQDRNILLCNYSQMSLVSTDFFEIEKSLGPVRYLGIWMKEETDCKEEEMKLVPPPKEEKPKPAEGEEAEAPPAEEEGEPKKKALDIYEHKWTKAGDPKNLSQWFFKVKKNVSKKEVEPMDCYKCFGDVIEEVAKSRDACVYQTLVMK